MRFDYLGIIVDIDEEDYFVLATVCYDENRYPFLKWESVSHHPDTLTDSEKDKINNEVEELENRLFYS